MTLPLFLGLIAIIIGILILVQAAKDWKKKQVLDTTPEISPAEAAPGLVKVAGVARPKEQVLEAALTGTESLAYSYKIEERKPKSRPGEKSRWSKIASDEEIVDFWIVAGDHRVRVDADNVSLELIHQRFDDDRVDDYEIFPVNLVLMPSDNKRRYEEQRIDPGDRVFVLGEAVERDGELVITDGSSSPMCWVSDGKTPGVSQKKMRDIFMTIFVAMVFFGFGVWMLSRPAAFGI